ASCDPGSLPGVDAYQVVLSRQPSGNVTYAAGTDGMTQLSLDGISWSSSVTFSFTGLTWDTPQIVQVRGVNDSIAQGLHFSRITRGTTGDPGLLIALPAGAVASGLAAAVDGDPTGRFQASASGSSLTIQGPAFTFSTTQDLGTLAIDGSSVHAYTGP